VLACPTVQVSRLCQDHRHRGPNLKQGSQLICMLEPSEQSVGRDSCGERRDKRRREGSRRANDQI
jgi:hypothetical protein